MARKYFSIKNCEFAFKCPRVWERLGLTDKEDERHCENCAKAVYLCLDDTALAWHVKAGHCVAVEDPMNEGTLQIGQIKANYAAPRCEL